MQNMVSAGILTGGKSKRMGSNKAYLEYNGTAFIEHIMKEFEDFPEILVSVDKKEKYQKLPCRLLEDELQEYGPVEGIYQLLKHANTPYILIVATDMPFLEKSFLNQFASTVTGKEACVVLKNGDHIEPLCSIYGKQLLPYLEEMRLQDEHRIRKLYAKADTMYLNAEEVGCTEKMLKNINTQEEYRNMF